MDNPPAIIQLPVLGGLIVCVKELVLSSLVRVKEIMEADKIRRLFVAFPVDPLVSTYFAEVLKRLKISADQAQMDFLWVPAENYHVTLKFLGPVPEPQIEGISGVLQKLGGRHEAMELKLRGLGAFPDLHHCRVLWAGVQAKRSLLELQSDLETSLEPLGYPHEDREYRPHLSLGRLRKIRSLKNLVSPFVRKDFGRIVAKDLVLYESQMHGKQVSYQPLKAFPLRQDFPETI